MDFKPIKQKKRSIKTNPVTANITEELYNAVYLVSQAYDISMSELVSQMILTCVVKSLTLEDLQAMKTLEQGQFDNLKIDTSNERLWLSRMTIEDGAPYNNQVTHERLDNGVWVKVDQWEAKC